MSRWPALAIALLVLAAPAAAQTPVLTGPVTIDGPGPDVQRLGGVSVARDGSGGLVYVKASHVFVSRLANGSFLVPEEVDGGLPASSSQPVIAAYDGGVLLVAFIDAGGLYVTQAQAGQPFTAPQLLSSPAANPAIAVSVHGKGYLAFTSGSAAPHDVRAAYWVGGTWSLVPGVLDASPGADAGAGSGRPAVAAAGDGVAIVAWGESGHVYTRRVWGTSPSVMFEQADVQSVAADAEVSADLPAVGAGDDSSYADVAFREVVSDGHTQQSRVLARRLRASAYDVLIAADGLSSPGSEGATDPRVAVTPAAHGLITSSRDSSEQVFATLLGGAGAPAGTTRVDAGANALTPYATPATTGIYSGAVAWQQAGGLFATHEISLRFFDGSAFGPEQVASSSSLGPADAARGLSADGDSSGDVALAWVQGDAGSSAIVAARLFYPPGGFAPAAPSAYARSPQPVLSWSAAREQWGPLTYTVSIDGVVVGQTQATSLVAPALPDGQHTWQVTAANLAGQTSTMGPADVWVDTVPPTMQMALTGAERAGAPLHLRLRYTDTPPPEPPGAASGAGPASVSWGDGTTASVVHGALHVYRRAGRYLLRVTLADRAANTTVLSRRVTVRAAARSGRR
jgi:hypothetical protein